MKNRDFELFRDYMNEYFPNLKLSGGLFFNAEIALRFEVGLNSPPYSKIESYIESVYIKSQLLFKSMISEEDDIFLVVNIRQDLNDSVPKINDIDVFKDYLREKTIISNVYIDKLPYFLYEDDEEDEIVTYQFVLKCKASDIKTSKLLKAIANQDVGINPRIHSECYFINIDKKIIYYLYDDRGVDIVGSDKEMIRYLYDKYSEWLLDCNKERMKNIFER